MPRHVYRKPILVAVRGGDSGGGASQGLRLKADKIGGLGDETN